MKKLSQMSALLKMSAILFLLLTQAQYATSQIQNIPVNEITGQVETGNITWVGTPHGLYLVNHKNNKVLCLTSRNSLLPSNNVTGICATPDESVYISTDKGILKYDGYDYILITTENTDLPSDNLTSIACDADGYLWIGTRDKGLVMMFNYKCKTLNSSNSMLTDNSVSRISKEANDSIIATLANGDVVEINENGMALKQRTLMELKGLVARK